MPAGLETYNDDGSVRTSVTDHFGRMLGSTTIDMPAGYLNRFQSGTISDYLALRAARLPLTSLITSSGTDLRTGFFIMVSLK